MAARTLYDKLWDNHVVEERADGSALIYIDRHLIHEVTSPQAFEGLRLAGRKPWRLAASLAVPDHNVPTTREERAGGVAAIADPVSRLQVQTLDDNCADFGIEEIPINDRRQGIVHVVGPEQGATLPGMTWSVATRIQAPTAPSAPWRTASAPPRWSMFSPRSAW
jgi:3-isopropylmalate/(R)-2-methylmalate dehydratase large subunit